MNSFSDLGEAFRLMEEYENLVEAHLGGLNGLSVSDHMIDVEDGEYDERLKNSPSGVAIRIDRIIERFRAIQDS